MRLAFFALRSKIIALLLQFIGYIRQKWKESMSVHNYFEIVVFLIQKEFQCESIFENAKNCYTPPTQVNSSDLFFFIFRVKYSQDQRDAVLYCTKSMLLHTFELCYCNGWDYEHILFCHIDLTMCYDQTIKSFIFSQATPLEGKSGKLISSHRNSFDQICRFHRISDSK